MIWNREKRRQSEWALFNPINLLAYGIHKEVGKRHVFAHCYDYKPSKINLFRHASLSAETSFSPFVETLNKDSIFASVREASSFDQTDE